MVLYCLSALSGAYLLLLFDALPERSWLAACLASTVVCASIARLRLLAAALAGFLLMAAGAASNLDDRLDAAKSGKPHRFSARILSFTGVGPNAPGFVVEPIARDDLPAKVRLSWTEETDLPQLGETWRFSAKLRRPRGYANPGGFDFEGWLYRQGIGAIGYVDPNAHSYRVHGAPMRAIDRLRRAVVERLDELLPDDEASAVLMAISVGARHRITRDQWDAYAATGTSHLMAISGLHVGLAAGSAYLLSWLLMAPFVRHGSLREIATVAAVCAALAYCMLSGLGIPARRASMMALVAAAVSLSRRRTDMGVLLAPPCLLIFAIEPAAILEPGFQLSFAAVAVLVWAAQPMFAYRRLPTAAARLLVPFERLLSLQFALLFGLFPLTVLLFQRFALLAPVVNLLALPVFNFLTVPLTLAGVFLDGMLSVVGDVLLEWAHASIRLVLSIVRHAGASELAAMRVVPVPLVIVLLPTVLVMLPKGWPGRRIALVGLIAAILHRPEPPEAGCFRFHVLDVGQGLATFIETRTYGLLFDTGPAYRSGGSAADLVVIPFLQNAGIERLDHLIVSHSDLDHSGGVGAIMHATDIGRVLVGERLDALGMAQAPCASGMAWVRDGVRFRILHPRPKTRWTGNNASCVLEVAVGGESLLLTGDIESPVEILMAHRGLYRPQTVVIVPHHGSRTSSGPTMVEATSPRTAIVAAGHANRWGFPKAEVVERWAANGARVVNTAEAGAVSQLICGDGGEQPLRMQRAERRYYWSDDTSDRDG